ncbi:MAG: 2-amino-4-hydroxy-6-hydroxymethyldihydropteridine diphosphokinase [Planctomycetota bacterium]
MSASTSHHECLIGIGANVGDRHGNLSQAIEFLSKADDVEHVATSELRESMPIGGPDSQSIYLNGAVRVRSKRSPEAMLKLLLATERRLGRERDKRWGPRTVDLDLLLYEQQVISQPGLEVPHPWMALRKFVMEPAAEIAPDWVHPRVDWTMQKLWDHLQNCRPLIAIAGLKHEQLPLIGQIAKKLSIGLISQEDRDDSKPKIPAKNDNSVPTESDPIELHDVLAERVKTKLQSNPKRPIVCDFWWESPLAHQGAELPSQPFPADLLILVGPTDNDDSAAKDASFRRLEQFATRPKLGPFLHVTSKDSARMVHDISAAIEGMLNEHDHDDDS